MKTSSLLFGSVPLVVFALQATACASPADGGSDGESAAVAHASTAKPAQRWNCFWVEDALQMAAQDEADARNERERREAAECYRKAEVAMTRCSNLCGASSPPDVECSDDATLIYSYCGDPIPR